MFLEFFDIMIMEFTGKTNSWLNSHKKTRLSLVGLFFYSVIGADPGV